MWSILNIIGNFYPNDIKAIIILYDKKQNINQKIIPHNDPINKNNIKIPQIISIKENKSLLVI
jgi:hypothetical protein